MDIVWINSESTNRPLSVDKTLSKGWVYLRRNIQETERLDIYENAVTMFTYEEAVPTEEMYRDYSLLNEMTQSVELKHDSAVIDDYTLTLIEEGVL